MNLGELKQRLLAGGFGPLNGNGPLIWEIGDWGLTINDLRLECRDGHCTVSWTERGNVTETLLSTDDEERACEYFHGLVLNEMMVHLVTYKDSASAKQLENRLLVSGIKAVRNDIPHFNGPNDPRFRLFVSGRDLLRAQKVAAGA